MSRAAGGSLVRKICRKNLAGSMPSGFGNGGLTTFNFGIISRTSGFFSAEISKWEKQVILRSVLNGFSDAIAANCLYSIIASCRVIIARAR